MNTKQSSSRIGIFVVFILLVLGLPSGSVQGNVLSNAVKAGATPVGTAFTYQGQLTQGGNAVTGSCDFHFGLWDSLTVGSQVAGTTTLSLPGVTFTNGFFTVLLDFGASVFTNEARWLEIGVKCAGDSTYFTLAPRQPLTAAPYALYAPAAGNATSVTNGVYTTGSYANPSWLTALAGNKISGFVANATNATTVTNGVYTTGIYADPGWLTALAGSKISGAVANATDADTVDGLHASALVSASHNHWGAGWSGTGTGLSLSGGTTGLSGNGSIYGVAGQSDVEGGSGVYGYASATTGTSDGVHGQSDSANGTGVTGINTTDGYGIFGWSEGTSMAGVGGMSPGTGVYGFSSGTSGVTYGVVGQVISPDGYAGYFNSSVGNGVTIDVPADKVGLNVASGLAQVGGNTIWHAGNDGSGSGLDADMLDGVHALSFWYLGGNNGTDPLTNFLGTLDNVALEFRVNNSRALRLEPNATSPNILGGYSGNSVTSGVVGAVIGGGGNSSLPNLVTDDYGVVGGGANNQAGDDAGTTSDRYYATVGGGYTNTASGYIATVGGGANNTASGVVATVGGGAGNIASQAGATVGGGGTNTASDYNATVGGGETNTASGYGATVGGGGHNTASSSWATVGGGNSNTASGSAATVGGGAGNIASEYYATVPGGIGAAATHYGEMAHASGVFAVIGDAQASEYILYNWTDNETQTELFPDGSTQRITLASSRTLSFDILIVAHSSTGGSSAGYQIKGLIENVGGTTAFVGTPVVTVLGEDVGAWDAFVVADDTNDALVIQVTGAASTTIRWVASVRTVEVGY